MPHGDVPVANVTEAGAGAPAPAPAPALNREEPATVLTRTEKILYAMRFYPAEARRTRSGKPYVRGLKRILGFHLTARERNTLWKEVTG